MDGADLELKRLEAAEVQSVMDAMVVQSDGERARDLLQLLQALMSRPMEVNRLVIVRFGRLRSPSLRRKQPPQESVFLCFEFAKRQSVALARQLLFRSKMIALDQKASGVELTDALLSSPVVAALRDELFRSSERGLGCSLPSAS